MDMSVPETIQYLSSDHFPVMFTINADTPFKNEFRQYRNYKRANWTVYVNSVSRSLGLTSDVINNLDTEDKIDTAIETLVTTLVEAERVSVPVVNCNPQKRDLPDRIKLLIRLRNVRRRQYCCTRDPLLRTNVENLNLQIRNESANYKFRNFGTNIRNLANGSSKFWKISKNLRNKMKYQPPLRSGNRLMVSNAEKANTLAEHFANSHNNQLRSDPETTSEVHRAMEDLESHALHNIDVATFTKPSEIKKIIQRLKSKKAPGQDVIRNAMLKRLPRKGLVHLTKVFNACLKLTYFPEKLKHATVVAIPKANKDVTLSTNYRPISLLSSLSKILERLILNRLNRHLEANPVVPNEQFGFKNGHSTNHQLARITRLVKQGFSAKKSTGMIP